MKRTTAVRIPIVDIGACTLCGGCIDMCPSVFSLNASGFIQVADLSEYPELQVNEAIKYCPENCITWEEI